MGLRTCISDKVLGDAVDAGLGTTLSELLLYAMRLPPTSQTSVHTMPLLTTPTPARMPTAALGVEDGGRNKMHPFVHPLG